MNGSTYTNIGSETVGFNPEQVKILLNLIEKYYEIEASAFDDLFNCFKSVFMGIDYKNYTGMKTWGWFSPEAKQFCEGILTTKMQEAYKRIYEIYISIYNMVIQGAKRWNIATGEALGYPKWKFASRHGKIITVPDSHDGIVGIDPLVQEHLKNSYNKCIFMNSFDYQTNSSVIVSKSAFLGVNQQLEINKRLQNAHNYAMNKCNEIYRIASIAINAAIQKYNITARAVASSFNAVQGK